MQSSSQVVSDNMFILSPDEGYAGTSRADWEGITEHLKFFKPANVDGMKSNDQCDICLEPFCASNPDSCFDPVSLPCGHAFGKDCIKDWIAAANGRGSHEQRQQTPGAGVSDDTTSYDLLRDKIISAVADTFTCPNCRHIFTLSPSEVEVPAIAARLRFWDLAYEKLGIIRSDDEEASRQDLRLFVSKAKPQPMTATSSRSVERRAQIAAMRFALRHARRKLTVTQRRLIESFFQLGCYGADDDLKAYTRRDYANRPIPFWCWEFDRLERGLNPWYGLGPGRFESRLQFVCEWIQQRLGSWARHLFKDMRTK